MVVVIHGGVHGSCEINPPSMKNKKMHLCLYASEAAAIVGKNPYQTPFSILMKVWKRYHHGADFAAARARLAEQCGVAEAQVSSREDAVANLIQTVPALQESLHVLENKVVTHETSLPEALEEARRATEKAEAEMMKGTTTKNINTAEVVKLVQSRIKCAYGQTQEKVSVARLGDVEENNATFFMKELWTSQNGRIVVSLGGKIDGKRRAQSANPACGRLIEIKNRKSRFMTPLPEYDIIQVHCYLFLQDETEIDVIEHLPDGREKTTAVVWKPELWRTVQDGLVRFARMLYVVINTEEWQDRALGCITLEDETAVFDDLCKHVG